MSLLGGTCEFLGAEICSLADTDQDILLDYEWAADDGKLSLDHFYKRDNIEEVKSYAMVTFE
jgi:hypothetical protein